MSSIGVFFSLVSIFLRVTLMMKVAVLLRRTTMAAIWARTPARLSQRVLGFVSMDKSRLTVELVLGLRSGGKQI